MIAVSDDCPQIAGTIIVGYTFEGTWRAVASPSQANTAVSVKDCV